ncbi:hypothetical protein J3Q64DRAFT_1716801 [Phycomyces blakesleeanus]|uniref:Uncharacterized protein n=1 Tax=Phycomyces blakesleeanus TaxID=4837 RepID=A0ABR3BIS2_PHYBL
MFQSRIRIDGVVLSSLLSECVNGTSDQEGFLLGSKVITTKQVIDDHSDVCIEQLESFIVIHGYHFLSPYLPRPYDASGNVLPNELMNQINCLRNEEDILGYFRYRSGTAVTPSVREDLLASSLSRSIKDFACFAILTESKKPLVYGNSFGFWEIDPSQQPYSKPQRLPVDIVNRSNPNQLEYQTFLSSASHIVHGTPSMQDAIRNSLGSNGLLNQYNLLYNSALNDMKNAAHELEAKEVELASLRYELNMYREQ